MTIKTQQDTQKWNSSIINEDGKTDVGYLFSIFSQKKN